MSQEPKKQPADKFNEGPVHVSIWENAGPKGAFRTASLQLRFKDKNEEWQTGNSYSSSDLKHLEKAAQEARSRIENWRQQANANPSPKTAA